MCMQKFSRGILIIILVAISAQIVALPNQVIIIRHAEKPLIGNELSEKGFERSNALRFYFQYDP